MKRLPEARFVLFVHKKTGHNIPPDRESIVKEVCPPDQYHTTLRRTEVLPVDISVKHCGLSMEEYLSVVTGATRVIHAAAAVRFDHSLEEARRINVGGTQNMLILAEDAYRRGMLKSFTYIGTAFVAGKRTGLIREDELDVGQHFNNTYEKTKCEAEKLIRSHLHRLPLTILRPSIIAGDSNTGMTTSFKAIYWPLKIYARGLWRTIPGFPDAVIDIVPVDFVAEAVAHLALSPKAIGSCAHLCGGEEGSATLREISQYAADYFGLTPPRFVNPTLFFALLRPILLATVWSSRRTVFHWGSFYRPYFRMRLLFDITQAKEMLRPEGICPPKVTEYLKKLFDYCVASDWGKHPIICSTHECPDNQGAPHLH